MRIFYEIKCHLFMLSVLSDSIENYFVIACSPIKVYIKHIFQSHFHCQRYPVSFEENTLKEEKGFLHQIASLIC